jgi:hypothetical protein
MTPEELARFSLVLKEADRLRAQIEGEEAIAREAIAREAIVRANDASGSPRLGSFGDRMVAAA